MPQQRLVYNSNMNDKPLPTCGWTIGVDVKCPLPRMPGQGYCRNHRNSYQRERYYLAKLQTLVLDNPELATDLAKQHEEDGLIRPFKFRYPKLVE